MIDAYLTHAAPSEPAEEQVELMRAWAQGQSPLVVLRSRRGLKRLDVVRALIEKLGLGAREEKVAATATARSSTLDTTRVDRRVWSVLADLLGADASRLPSLRPRQFGVAEAVYYREPTEAATAPLAAAPAPAPPSDEPDEVDLLFTAG